MPARDMLSFAPSAHMTCVPWLTMLFWILLNGLMDFLGSLPGLQEDWDKNKVGTVFSCPQILRFSEVRGDV